jgi:hypothetical protein
VAAGFMFMLELQHIPGLRFLDASTFAERFANDYEAPLRNAAGPGGGGIGGIGDFGDIGDPDDNAPGLPPAGPVIH